MLLGCFWRINGNQDIGGTISGRPYVSRLTEAILYNIVTLDKMRAARYCEQRKYIIIKRRFNHKGQLIPLGKKSFLYHVVVI